MLYLAVSLFLGMACSQPETTLSALFSPNQINQIYKPDRHLLKSSAVSIHQVTLHKYLQIDETTN